MASKALLLCLIALIFTSTIAYDEEDHVLILHDADFPKVFEDFPNILIEFYAPWYDRFELGVDIVNNLLLSIQKLPKKFMNKI